MDLHNQNVNCRGGKEKKGNNLENFNGSQYVKLLPYGTLKITPYKTSL